MVVPLNAHASTVQVYINIESKKGVDKKILQITKWGYRDGVNRKGDKIAVHMVL